MNDQITELNNFYFSRTESISSNKNTIEKSEVLEDGTVEYKITKIFDEIDILITEEEITEEPNGYRVNFIGEKFTIKVLSQDYDGINDYGIQVFTQEFTNEKLLAEINSYIKDGD